VAKAGIVSNYDVIHNGDTEGRRYTTIITDNQVTSRKTLVDPAGTPGTQTETTPDGKLKAVCGFLNEYH